jgi:hypothetical protein
MGGRLERGEEAEAVRLTRSHRTILSEKGNSCPFSDGLVYAGSTLDRDKDSRTQFERLKDRSDVRGMGVWAAKSCQGSAFRL